MNNLNRNIFLSIFSFICYLYSGVAGATIINVNSLVNSVINPVDVFLQPGTYTVQPIGIADGGTYDAWSAWASTSCANLSGCTQTNPTTLTGWTNLLDVLSPNITSVSVNGAPLTPVAVPSFAASYFILDGSNTMYQVADGLVWPNASLALADAQPSMFSLSAAGDVGFTIGDTPSALGDNRGGLSLLITTVTQLPTNVPEPSTIWLLLLGLAGIFLNGKGRLLLFHANDLG